MSKKTKRIVAWTVVTLELLFFTFIFVSCI